MASRKKRVSDVFSHCANVRARWEPGPEDFCVCLVDEDGSLIGFERFKCDAEGYLTPRNWYAAMGVVLGYAGAANAAKDAFRPTLLFGGAPKPEEVAG